MAHYLIAELQIHDRERYSAYSDGFMAIFSQYAGELLSVDEDVTVLEGNWQATRTVLIKFPSKADAIAWYQSDEYQALAEHRLAASDGNIIMIRGLDDEN